MRFPPIVEQSDKITALVRDLDILREAFHLIPIPKTTLVNLRRSSILKSSLFSARIEGNPLHLTDLASMDDTDIHVLEITNINRAYEFLDTKKGDVLDIQRIRDFHTIVMNALSSEAGKFRTEESAIFNTAGIALYLAPRRQDIQKLLTDLCHRTNAVEFPVPVVSAVTHIWFEKIHPFTDGNGRVGRLLATWILQKWGYDFTNIVPFEQYLDEHRQEYYDALFPDTQNVTQFVVFFLTALLSQARQSFEEIKHPKVEFQSNLLPRRQEIVNIIRDHVTVSFDFLSRRFRKIPTSTLHYDLLSLQKKGYIEKLGSTRGALYREKRT
jgi:Fic family protein